MGGKYNYDVSKMRDTTFYMSAYFFDNEMFTHFRNRFDNVEEVMQPYHEFKQRHKDFVLPMEITPFVYNNHDMGIRSFLTQYFCNNLNHKTGTESDTLNLLMNRDLLKRQYFEYLFPRTNDKIIDQLMQQHIDVNVATIICDLPFDEKTKVYITALIYDFPTYHNILVETYQNVFKIVDEYYNEPQSQETIEEIKQQINDKQYNIVERFRNIFKFPEAVQSFPFYFSLFNGYMVHYSVYKSDVCFGLGLYFKCLIESRYSVEHVSLKTHYKVMNSDIRYEMVQMFSEYKKLCVADIAQIKHYKSGWLSKYEYSTVTQFDSECKQFRR